MSKFFTIISFIILCYLVVSGFATATSYAQLGVATFFYPLVVYFAFKVFSSGKKPNYQPPQPEGVRIESVPKIERAITTDIEKRAFLKLVGGMGASFFLVSLLNKKLGGYLPGAAGFNPVSSVENILNGYKISDINDGVISYYGFTTKTGAWYIMREDTNDGTFRYTSGKSNYPISWESHEKLQYSYFNSAFGSS